MNKKNLITLEVIALLIIGLGYFIFSGPQIGVIGSEHSHANFMVFIDGKALNFVHAEYMVKVKEVHIEDMNGVTIHKHATGVTLGHFFKTLGFKFNEKCFILDNDEEYCNKGDKKLKFYVNEQLNYDSGDYEIKDGERYLISYGSESEEVIQEQINKLNEIEI